jgi:serine protease DegS/serine protease DegQ
MPDTPSSAPVAWREHLAYFARWAVVGLAVAFVVVWLRPGLLLRAPVEGATSGPRSYAAAVGVAGPAVVNIYANRIVTEQAGYSRLEGNPAAQRFLGFTPVGPPRQRIEESLGSAVIVTTDGYLLTNNHVVKEKDNIRAVLWDGRTTEARIVATDEDTDLAVLKIDVADLPAARFAKTDGLQIGDVVLAIGNPFGLGQSVTMGIVSALGAERLNLGLTSYEYLIQTDAAVNTGNSGGALVNAEGELVGVNTAMFGRGRGAEGISFAIPAETARVVLDDIVRQGYVTRGWLGAELGQIQVANATTGERRIGLQVLSLGIDSPASVAGLRAGDIIMRMHGLDVESIGQFRSQEANMRPGTKVQIEAVRAGLPFLTEVELGQKPRR